jgi:hypothetical protein
MITLKGTSFYQSTIKGLKNWSLGILRLEPNNQYDSEACAVYVEEELVGYLEKGWKEEDWGEEMLTYINNPQREGHISLRKVGGYNMDNGEVATEGLRLITKKDLHERI